MESHVSEPLPERTGGPSRVTPLPFLGLGVPLWTIGTSLRGSAMKEVSSLLGL